MNELERLIKSIDGFALKKGEKALIVIHSDDIFINASKWRKIKKEFLEDNNYDD